MLARGSLVALSVADPAVEFNKTTDEEEKVPVLLPTWLEC
jgi:hypothetical protein